MNWHIGGFRRALDESENYSWTSGVQLMDKERRVLQMEIFT